MASRVTKWTVADDAWLERFLAYIVHEHDLELIGTLGPEDESTLQLLVWPDADQNGDHATTNSTFRNVRRDCFSRPRSHFPDYLEGGPPILHGE